MAAEGDCEERGTGTFSVEEVHKIAILDIRLANCDRNGGNILVKRCTGQQTCRWQLIPIDHGYCLPSTLADVSFEWMYWPQVIAYPPLEMHPIRTSTTAMQIMFCSQRDVAASFCIASLNLCLYYT